MTFTVYVGPPGSGKGHELLRHVIVPAVKSGRRILHNVDGLLPQKVCEFAGVEFDPDLFEKWDPRKVAPQFWPTEENPDPEGSPIRPGDLVIIDEALTIFRKGQNVPTAVLDFLVWHRHLTNGKFSCDVVAAAQALTEMHTGVTSLLENTYVVHRVRSLVSNMYTVTCYLGRSIRKSAEVSKHTYAFDKKIFGLYSSFSGAAPTNEGSPDTRNKSGAFLLFFCSLLLIPVFIYFIWQKFVPSETKKTPETFTHETQQKNPISSALSSDNDGPVLVGRSCDAFSCSSVTIEKNRIWSAQTLDNLSQ